MKILAYISYIIILLTFATLITLTVKNFADHRESQLNCTIVYLDNGAQTKECDK